MFHRNESVTRELQYKNVDIPMTPIESLLQHQLSTTYLCSETINSDLLRMHTSWQNSTQMFDEDAKPFIGLPKNAGKYIYVVDQYARTLCVLYQKFSKYHRQPQTSVHKEWFVCLRV